MNKKEKLLKETNKRESNTKLITKFTFTNTLRSRIFWITNILMVCIVIFLACTVIKLTDATQEYITNSIENVSNNIVINVDIEKSDAISTIDTIRKTFNPGFVIAFILFFTIYFYGYMVSNSISEEKTSRVIETLVMSADYKEIVKGKVMAMGLLSIMQTIELLLVFAFTYAIKKNLFHMMSISNIKFDFINLFKNMNFTFQTASETRTIVLVTFIFMSLIFFFIFGYLFYAFVCAIAGAGVEKAEDVQMVNGPISIMAMIGFYLSALTTSMPESKWVIFAKYLPFSSAFTMPVNIINGTTNLTEIGISLLILILITVWLGFMAIKVYKHIIFNYGNKTTISDIFRIVFLREK